MDEKDDDSLESSYDEEIAKIHGADIQSQDQN